MNLFIDTHLNDVVIILSNGENILKKEIITNVKQNSTIIMPTIKKVLGDIQPESLIVVNGPGSFTGTRLGVTIAKTFAYTLNAEIKTITSLECMAVSLDQDEKIVAFSDKNGYYVGIFDKENNLIGNYEYLSNFEFEEFSQKHEVVLEVELNYEKILNFTKTLKVKNPHEVNPIYIKKIDVEK